MKVRASDFRLLVPAVLSSLLRSHVFCMIGIIELRNNLTLNLDGNRRYSQSSANVDEEMVEASVSAGVGGMRLELSLSMSLSLD